MITLTALDNAITRTHTRLKEARNAGHTTLAADCETFLNKLLDQRLKATTQSPPGLTLTER